MNTYEKIEELVKVLSSNVNVTNNDKFNNALMNTIKQLNNLKKFY